MRSANSYQDIDTPEDEEEQNEFDSALEEMLDEYDPDEAGSCSFTTYKNNCMRFLRSKKK